MRPDRRLSPAYPRKPQLLDATDHDDWADDDKHLNISRWTTLGFGKHEGKTLPELFALTSPGFFGSVVRPPYMGQSLVTQRCCIDEFAP